MPRKCTICEHPQHQEINQALLQGAESGRQIARRFDLSSSALQRHRTRHLPEILALGLEVKRMQETSTPEGHSFDGECSAALVGKAQVANLACLELLKRVCQERHISLMSAIDTIIHQIEQQADVLGTLEPNHISAAVQEMCRG